MLGLLGLTLTAALRLPHLLSVAHSSLSGNDGCVDGQCSLPAKNASVSAVVDGLLREASPAQQHEDKVQQLMGMGWDRAVAQRALESSGFDLEQAAVLLDEEEKEREEVQRLAAELELQHGWNREVAEAALAQANKNVTEALLMLEQEERIITENFENAVRDMLANGWDEVVARQALLTQWTLDQRKQAGMNVTVPAETLAKIKPTLKKTNDTDVDKKQAKVINHLSLLLEIRYEQRVRRWESAASLIVLPRRPSARTASSSAPRRTSSAWSWTPRLRSWSTSTPTGAGRASSSDPCLRTPP